MFSEKIELIQNTTIKAQFKEINKCIENESYRAAIVLLWNVCILDLVTKVQELSDIYNVSSATKEIKKLEAEWQNKPTSAEWEKEILIACRDQIKNISQAQYEVLSHLHKKRHLCAHPVKDSVWDLYKPTATEVLYFYENTLDLAVVPAYLSQKNFGDFLNDISQNSSIYETENDFANFLNQKYFRLLDTRSQKYYFKNLWKFCFKKTDQGSNTNRVVNTKALMSLMKKMGEDVSKDIIIEDTRSFSDITLVNDNIVKNYIELSINFPYNFHLLEDATRTGIKNCIEKNSYYTTLCFFIQTSFSNHLEKLEKMPLYDKDENKKIDVSALAKIMTINGLTSAEKERLLSIFIKCYIKSYSYDFSDLVFQNLIKPHLQIFSDKQIEELLHGIDNNQETYSRRNAPQDHKLILTEIQRRKMPQNKLDLINQILRYTHY